MMYKAKVAVYSDIRTKHSKVSEHHIEFLNVKPWWNVKKPLGVKRLITVVYKLYLVLLYLLTIILLKLTAVRYLVSNEMSGSYYNYNSVSNFILFSKY